jgi:hypothetical protein
MRERRRIVIYFSGRRRLLHQKDSPREAAAAAPTKRPHYTNLMHETNWFSPSGVRTAGINDCTTILLCSGRGFCQPTFISYRTYIITLGSLNHRQHHSHHRFLHKCIHIRAMGYDSFAHIYTLFTSTRFKNITN